MPIHSLKIAMEIIFGGVVAAVAGLLQSWYAHHWEVKAKAQEDADFARNVLSAIRREIEALTLIYDNGVRALLAEVPPKGTFNYRLGLTQNWFLVFEANAGNLGRIDPKIAQSIILLYMNLRHLVEEYRINNGYLDQADQIAARRSSGKTDPHTEIRAKNVEEALEVQAQKLKKTDAQVREMAKAVISEFDRIQIR
jgi:hypothetical protein